VYVVFVVLFVVGFCECFEVVCDLVWFVQLGGLGYYVWEFV